MKLILVALLIMSSFSVFSECKKPKALKAGKYQFSGKVFGLKAVHYEYIESSENTVRVTDLEKKGFKCTESERAWKVCTKVKRNPKLPEDLVKDIQANMQRPYFDLTVEKLVSEPILQEETDEKCVWKVEQPSRGITPIDEYLAPFYILEDYKTAEWVTLTPIKENSYEAPWKRVQAANNLRHVQVTGVLNAVKGVNYTYEGEFTPVKVP